MFILEKEGRRVTRLYESDRDWLILHGWEWVNHPDRAIIEIRPDLATETDAPDEPAFGRHEKQAKK